MSSYAYVVPGLSVSSQVHDWLKKNVRVRTQTFTVQDVINALPHLVDEWTAVSGFLSSMHHDRGALKVKCKRGNLFVYVIVKKSNLYSQTTKRIQHRGWGSGNNRKTVAPQERDLIARKRKKAA